MAAVMQGGASPSEPSTATAERPVAAPVSLDLNFVAEAVQGGRWAGWGEKFSNLDDLAAKVAAQLQPGQRVRRLVIAAYSAEHTSGFVSFDIGFGNRERIDGLNLNPIRPEVIAKLEQLKPMLDPAGVFELRVAGMGQGEHGRRALQAAADVLGIAARGPVEKSAGLTPTLGLVLDWLTVFPSAWHHEPVRSNWLETWTDGIRTVEPAYIPIPGAAARRLPSMPSTGPGDLQFVTRGAAPWLPGVPAVSGMRDLVDQAIAALRPGEQVKRLAITTANPGLYDGYVSFDDGDSESIDGSIREQPGYPHLQVIVAQVQEQLERLRPHLAPQAVLEIRAAGFGSGESGRRAMRTVADVLGAEVRAAVVGPGELRTSGGLVTRWRSVFPTSTGVDGTDSAWREVSQPTPTRSWVPVDPASYAPIRGLEAPLPDRPAPAPAPEPVTVAAPQLAIPLVVVCAGCGRVLDESLAIPLRARTPCQTCGSRARRQEPAPTQAKPGAMRRLRFWRR